MITSIEQYDSIIQSIKQNPIQEAIDCEILYDLGYFFENGLFDEEKVLVEIDLNKSYYWYREAMLKGSLNAKIQIANFLSEGKGCEKDIDQATSLYLSCIEEGLSIAAFNLGTIYRDQKNYNKAFKYYLIGEELMSKEYEKTTYSLNVIVCYLYGIGITKDIDEGVRRLKTFTNQKNDYSCQYDIDEANYILGVLYLQGLGMPLDIDKARYHLLKADQDQDHSSAQELLLIIGRE